MTSAEPAPGPSPRGSRCWTVLTPGGEIDVELTARDADRLADVRSALAAVLGLADAHLWHGSTPLADDLDLGAAELAHGSVLGLSRPGPRDEPACGLSALELHVVGGSDAGRRVPLEMGDHVVGRGGPAEIELDDPDVSRRHLLVSVGSGAVTARDLGSTNGTTLAGAPLTDRPRDWPMAATAHLGSSTLALAGPTGYPARAEPARDGRTVLHPHPMPAPSGAPVEVAYPAEPADPSPRGFPWLPAALPAVGGVVMAVLLHTPHFLFFALLSPLTGLGTWAWERLSGRRGRRRDLAAHRRATRTAEQRLADAVCADVRVLNSAVPHLAALTAAARHRTHPLWARRATDADALTVRLGTGPGATRVIRLGADGSRSPEEHPHLPVVIDLRESGGLAVVGPRRLALGVLTGIVAQLVALFAPGEVDLLLLLSPDRAADWRWARWLPHLPGNAVLIGQDAAGEETGEPGAVLTELLRRRRAAAGGSPSPGVLPSGWLVVVVDGPIDPRAAATLRDADACGVIPLVLAETPQALPVSLRASLRLTGETGQQALLQIGNAARGLTVDRLPRRVASSLARDLAPLQVADSTTGLPRGVRLVELPQTGLRWTGSALQGSWPRDRSRLTATVGRTAAGPLEIDLCRLGPHALVAGTTGSGKSELLRSLVAGLALGHPPDRCSFLLVDYKGGAAFAEAAALPHTVGVLTDLDGRSTERALRSLAAELLRREAILAQYGVADLAALPDTADLARLVIVVDEFATLADELPAFVPGLVGIAQRGRSLGVHLVLATQRPAGVVSPEIRANCTLRICLRTTDEADSRDVLGVPFAAHLPLERPGRAYLRAGAATPVLFQAARVTGDASAATAPSVQVRPWVWPPAGTPGGEVPGGEGESELAALCAAVGRYAARTDAPSAHRPWRPPLPERLTAAELDQFPRSEAGAGSRGGAAILRIGLVDRPDIQAWEPLEMDLAAGGGWLAVGAARSGRTTLLRTVLAEAAGRLEPQRLHVHVLDHGGGALAAEAAPLPHVGTTVTADDPLRTVRLLSRLSEEVAMRRAGLDPGPAPLVLLLVDGVESLIEQLDEYDAGGSGDFLRLVRDGAAAGLTCFLTAARAVPGGRLSGAVHRRLVLPLADKADYAVAGIDSSSVPSTRCPGRALVGETAAECQIALPRDLPSPPSVRGGGSALKIPPLPERPVLPASAGRALAGGSGLPIGPGGDEGATLTLDVTRSGGLLVAGPPGSGRTTALTAFAGHLTDLGVPVARIGEPGAGRPAAGPGTAVDPDDDVALAEWLAGLDGGIGAVLVDDVDLLADAPALRRLPEPGRARGVLVFASGCAADLARQFQGPVAALRRQRTALLLCPGPGDADLLGIRLPRTPVPRRPGSGWLIRSGTAERVQVARRAATGPQVPGERVPVHLPA